MQTNQANPIDDDIANTLCEKSRRLRLEGDVSGALDCARQAAQIAPDRFATNIELAHALSQANASPSETATAWQHCITTFPKQTNLMWFKRLLAAKRAGWGDLQNRTDIDALEQELTALHNQARALWPETAQDDDPKTVETSQAVTQWILLSRAHFLSAAFLKPFSNSAEFATGNKRALAAWEAYFDACQDMTAAEGHVLYLKALVVNRPQNLEERIAWLTEKAGEKWPADDPDRPVDDKGATYYFRLGKVLLGRGQIKAALAELAKIPEGRPQSEPARALEQIAQSFSMSGVYQELTANPQGLESQDDSLMIWQNDSGSDKVIYYFAGGGHEAFFRIASLHPSLKATGCHIVYLIDPQLGFFLKSQRWENFAILGDELREITKQLGATKAYMIGISSGGYAALRMGADLDAERILAFSPLTTPATTSWPATRQFFKSICAEDPTFIANIDDYYQSKTAQPSAIVVFGEGSDRDRSAAEKLEHFDTVRLHPLKGCNNHGAIKTVIAEGRVAPLLTELLADTL